MSGRNVVLFLGALLFLGVLVVGGVVVSQGSSTIAQGVTVGGVDVGGRSRKEAERMLNEQWNRLQQDGIGLQVDQNRETIRLDAIDAHLDVPATAQMAWDYGRQGGVIQQWVQRLISPSTARTIPAVVTFSEPSLVSEVSSISQRYDEPRLDVRFVVNNGQLEVRTDTLPGQVMDQDAVIADVSEKLKNLDTNDIVVHFQPDLPQGDPGSAAAALQQARAMVSSPILFEYHNDQYSLTPAQLAPLISSTYQDHRLVPDVDQEKLSQAVAAIAQSINTDFQETTLRVSGNKVVDFVPPQPGKKLEEEKTIGMINDILQGRAGGTPDPQFPLELPVEITHPAPEASAASLGITQLIGKATTTFRGSPANRISNINNGERFLNGAIIAPGEEFSTLKTLGTIDNTTGYLPELVIKEDRTTPEYGGGLCQVSTTLFRAVMNAGLPITQRQNHSYRVPYYERDGDGKMIGPGLDATIYSPAPDFRFLNDTKSSIVIQGSIVGDKITFALYGTSDGRTSTIDGPHTLSSVPAGPPIITETDTLPPGEKKQVEHAHPGGTATATYSIHYPDGTVKTQVFNSSYKKWPERYLIGVAAKPADASMITTPAPAQTTPSQDSAPRTESHTSF